MFANMSIRIATLVLIALCSYQIAQTKHVYHTNEDGYTDIFDIAENTYKDSDDYGLEGSTGSTGVTGNENSDNVVDKIDLPQVPSFAENHRQFELCLWNFLDLPYAEIFLFNYVPMVSGKLNATSTLADALVAATETMKLFEETALSRDEMDLAFFIEDKEEYYARYLSDIEFCWTNGWLGVPRMYGLAE